MSIFLSVDFILRMEEGFNLEVTSGNSQLNDFSLILPATFLGLALIGHT